MRKIQVFSDDRPSKRPMPCSTPSHASCATSSATLRRKGSHQMITLRKAVSVFSAPMAVIALLAASLAPAAFAAPQAQTAGNVFTDPPKNYQLTQGWFQGRETFYYDFGSNSATND